QAFVLLVDCAASLLSVWLAFYLRIDQTSAPLQDQRYVYVLAIALFVPIFVRLGLYRAIFRYTGINAVVSTSIAVAIYGGLLFFLLLWFDWEKVPRSIGLIQPILFLLLAGGWRIIARYLLSGLSETKYPQ